MAKFTVTVFERYAREITVEAEDSFDALDKANEMIEMEDVPEAFYWDTLESDTWLVEQK